MADVTCARCKKSAPPGARFGMCVECTADVRKAEAKRQAACKKRKVEQSKANEALRKANAMLVKQAIQPDAMPAAEVEALCEFITSRKASGDHKSDKAERILGGYGEMHVRCSATKNVVDERYDLFDLVMAGGSARGRGGVQAQTVLTKCVEDGIAAFTERASNLVHRGRSPVYVKHVAFLAQMGYGGLGSTLGKSGWEPQDTPGQVLHEDVMPPEVMGIIYLNDSIGTLTYQGMEAPLLDMVKRTGKGPEDVCHSPTLTAYYLAKNLMIPPDEMKAGLQVKFRDADSGHEYEHTASLSAPEVKAGDMAVIDGGLPHGGPPVAAGKWQLRLFMIASPLRTADPYKGYIQILGGESELFWAIMSSTPELRTQNWEAWKQALPYWAEWYAGCALIETAGPMWKVLTALTEVEDLPVKIVRETITRAVQHVKENKQRLGLAKWSCTLDTYEGSLHQLNSGRVSRW